MNRLSLLLIDGTQVGPFVQQQLHHLWDTSIGLSGTVPPISLLLQTSNGNNNIWNLTSWNPLWAAWCRAVLPVRSAMFRLLRWVSRASAQRVARLAVATCSGVCQNLSRAFASAPRLSSSPTALWSKWSNRRVETHPPDLLFDGIPFSDTICWRSHFTAVKSIQILFDSFKVRQCLLELQEGFVLSRDWSFLVAKWKKFICLLHSWMQLLCATGSTTHDL